MEVTTPLRPSLCFEEEKKTGRFKQKQNTLFRDIKIGLACLNVLVFLKKISGRCFWATATGVMLFFNLSSTRGNSYSCTQLLDVYHKRSFLHHYLGDQIRFWFSKPVIFFTSNANSWKAQKETGRFKQKKYILFLDIKIVLLYLIVLAFLKNIRKMILG